MAPQDALADLRADNLALIANRRAAHELAAKHGDVASTSQIETWIDEVERREWFLFEATRNTDAA